MNSTPSQFDSLPFTPLPHCCWQSELYSLTSPGGPHYAPRAVQVRDTCTGRLMCAPFRAPFSCSSDSRLSPPPTASFHPSPSFHSGVCTGRSRCSVPPRSPHAARCTHAVQVRGGVGEDWRRDRRFLPLATIDSHSSSFSSLLLSSCSPPLQTVASDRLARRVLARPTALVGGVDWVGGGGRCLQAGSRVSVIFFRLLGSHLCSMAGGWACLP